MRFRLLIAGAALTALACHNDSPVAVDSGTESDSTVNPARVLKLRSATSLQLGFISHRVNAPAVYLTDESGAPVEGVYITFELTPRDGVLEKTQVRTNANGYASAGKWTLGSDEGLSSVVASAVGLEPVFFFAVAVDPGAIVWYDLKRIVDCGETTTGAADECVDSVANGDGREPDWIESIALTENGFFGREITSDNWLWGAGRYSSSKAELTVTYSFGAMRGYRQPEERIWFVFCGDFAGAPSHCEGWVYVKRTGD